MQKALDVLKQCIATGEFVDRPDLQVGIETITGLFGYDDVDASREPSSSTRRSSPASTPTACASTWSRERRS